MDNQPPVSIFITTYLDSEERGKVLRATCENALAQNYDSFEVVVSDNGGSYAAEKALSDIADDRLRVFRNSENLGQAGNSNMCMERCRYDIIKVNCDDDLLHPDCLKATVPYVDDDTYVVVEKGAYIIGEEPESLAQELPEFDVEVRQPGYDSSIWGFTHVCLPGCCLFTRRFFAELGGYDERTRIFDFDFLIECRLRKKVAYLQYPLCLMGSWEGSLSQQMMQSRPYFFTIEGLYPRFRLLKCKNLGFKNNIGLAFLMLRMFITESLRVPRHLLNKKYWFGYGDYLAALWKHIRMPREMYTARSEGA